jgi:hypothetical protein
MLGNDIFVPRFMFVRRGDKIITVVTWADAIPIAIPQAEAVFIVPTETLCWKDHRGTDKDVAMAEWSQIEPILAPFPMAQAALPYRLLRFSRPPIALVTQLKALTVPAEKQAGVSVDQILDAELLAQARIEIARNPTIRIAGGEK